MLFSELKLIFIYTVKTAEADTSFNILREEQILLNLILLNKSDTEKLSIIRLNIITVAFSLLSCYNIMFVSALVKISLFKQWSVNNMIIYIKNSFIIKKATFINDLYFVKHITLQKSDILLSVCSSQVVVFVNFNDSVQK